MRLSNLEEGSYNNAPEPKKMQVTVADKKSNTEAWKRYQAGDSRYEFKNPTTEAEKQSDIREDSKGRAESIKNIDEILVKMGADAPSDIIADIMHWIDAHPGENLEDLIRQANGYYNDELEESTTVTEAGGYYTQPIYDMIKQHGYPKVMHELLTSLDADVIQDFINRAELDENTYDTKDFEFNPRAGHRDQMSHPENRGLDANPNKSYSPRPKARPKNLKAPMTSPRPKARPKDLEMKFNINKAVQQAVASEGKSPHKKGTAKYKKHMAAMHAESKINEFGPDERYMKIGNNTMIANKKTGSVSSTLNLGGDKSATVNNHLNKDGSVGKVSARGTVNGVKFKASNNVTGTAPKASASMRGITINASEEPKVREAGSPWTTTGKHPEKMTTDELWSEIAVFDHIQDRGERLTPKDMMRLDSLFSYMDTAEMNEQIKSKADSMMESAVWKAKRNK